MQDDADAHFQVQAFTIHVLARQQQQQQQQQQQA